MVGVYAALRACPALVRPALLGELLWLSWVGPRYALRAARVLQAGLARLA